MSLTLEGQKTLEGRKIALTSSADDPFTPAPHLAALGAELIFYPSAEPVPVEETADLDQALHRAAQGGYDWLILPTRGAVSAVADRLSQLGLKPQDLQPVKLAAYGAMTHQSLDHLLPGVKSEIGETANHAELVKALRLAPGARVLILQPARARTDWVQLFEGFQAQVTSLPAYRLKLATGGDPLPSLLWSGAVDAIVFTSEDNVRHFAQRLTFEGGTLAMLDHVFVACIDPQTATAARNLGLHVQVVPSTHRPDTVAEELANFLAVRAPH